MPMRDINTTLTMHVHIAKMAGRSVMYSAERTFGIRDCRHSWMKGVVFYGDPSQSRSLLSTHCGSDQCFFSFEDNLEDMETACGAAPSARPLPITLLRSPMSWLFSAMAHLGTTGDALEQIERHGESWTSREHPLYYFPRKIDADNSSSLTFILTRLTSGSANKDPTMDAASWAKRAIDNLERMAFGIVEYMEDSLLLLLYQLRMTERARRHCPGATKTEASGLQHVGEAHSNWLNISSYAIAQTLAREMQVYRLVYSHALVLFQQRVTIAKAVVCQP